MSGWRAGSYRAVIGIGVLVILVPGGLARASEPNPADRLFDRARQAVHAFEFSGSVRIWWRDARGGHATTVAVAARRGGLDVDGGRIVHDDGRAWMRRGGHWITLWGDAADVASPSVAAKYDVTQKAGPVILRRATDRLSVRRRGRPVEVVDFDHATGVVLARNRFDGTGRSDLRMEFVSLDGPRRRHGPDRRPPRPADAHVGKRQTASPSALRSLGQGFRLVEARSMAGRVTQMRYSDGVFEASVFAQPGATDWKGLPEGGQDVRYGSVRARRYRTPVGTVLVWQVGAQTLTCVTDAIGSDQAAMIRNLSRDHEGFWTGLVRFVNGPFHWN